MSSKTPSHPSHSTHPLSLHHPHPHNHSLAAPHHGVDGRHRCCWRSRRRPSFASPPSHRWARPNPGNGSNHLGDGGTDKQPIPRHQNSSLQNFHKPTETTNASKHTRCWRRIGTCCLGIFHLNSPWKHEFDYEKKITSQATETKIKELAQNNHAWRPDQ